MLKAKVIPRLLEQVHVDGVEASLLMRDDGSLMGTAGPLAHEKSKEAQVLAAILSNIWSDYENAGAQLHSGPLKTVMMDCELGNLGSVRIGNQYIAAVYGKSATTEAIKAQLERLFSNLDPITKTLEPARTM
mmetsp:Transcript_4052/g.10244  ORF Transcript_4052/g.10244 Transcript_4052/m.10244 type:complete len:132 (+) Transcript_4052:46-441(+)